MDDLAERQRKLLDRTYMKLVARRRQNFRHKGDHCEHLESRNFAKNMRMINVHFAFVNRVNTKILGGVTMSFELAEAQLLKRGVKLEEIAKIVYKLQLPYHDDLTVEQCYDSVKAVLQKREVQYTLFTGIALDELAEQKLLPEPLQSIMEADEPLYGVDETMALGITSVFGMIGLTSFGYLDKVKPDLIGKLNNQGDHIHVYLDDLVAGLAAAASARIAHKSQKATNYSKG